MEAAQETTQQKIRKIAKNEFLHNTFDKASLRQIVKKAGVTTGAFYGYYTSKEALFEDLVGESYDKFIQMNLQFKREFNEMSPQEQKGVFQSNAFPSLHALAELMYEKKNDFKIILRCSKGTKYENFVEVVTRVQMDAFRVFSDTLRSLGIEPHPVSEKLEHTLHYGMYSSFFDILLQDTPLEEAQVYVAELQKFYIAGWRTLMGF